MFNSFAGFGVFDRNGNPFAQPVQVLHGNNAIQQRDIFFFDTKARMADGIGEGAVIGQEQQTFGIGVQAAHRV
jgi:hypothetical protein